MITRKAMLIGYPGGHGNLPFLSGVGADLRNYQSLLESKAGGQWRPDEIETLLDPNVMQVIDSVRQATADYTFLVFSGYGAIQTYTNSDSIFLKDGELLIGKLVSPSHKQTIIIDASSEFVLAAPLPLFAGSAAAGSDNLERSARDSFDEAVKRTPEGIVLLFSHRPGQVSLYASAEGGVFSQALIQAAERWGAIGQHGAVLTLDVAFEDAKKLLGEKVLSLQTPEMAGQIRRLSFPPFAIGAAGSA